MATQWRRDKSLDVEKGEANGDGDRKYGGDLREERRGITPEVALVLLVATLAAVGSSLALLVTLDYLPEEGLALVYLEVEDPEWDGLDWEWRLRMAATPEAYWY